MNIDKIRRIAVEAMDKESMVKAKDFIINACGDDPEMLAPFNAALDAARHVVFLGEMRATINNPRRVTERIKRLPGISAARTPEQEAYLAERAHQVAERTKLIPALREIVRFDEKLGALVWCKTTGPRRKEGAIAGGINQNGTRQLMINKTRYVGHELVYALHHGVWPSQRLKFRDGDINNIHPDNLYLKDEE